MSDLRMSVMAALLLPAAAFAADFEVVPRQVADRKAVIATVEPVKLLVARARLSGTLVALNVREGDRVEGKSEIARVLDSKLALQIEALDQRIKSHEAQRNQARLDLGRAQELKDRGVATQSQLDQAKTLFDVAERQLSAMMSDRTVLEEQAQQGAVLAPAAGRVLSVPVSNGRVVMAGEVIATLAEDGFILRLSLPERHARSIRAGDRVAIAARGEKEGEAMGEGTVRLVYPEIQGGRVVADVSVEGLGGYYVGEKARVLIETGSRSALIVPAQAVFRRAGVAFVRLTSGANVVVQPGQRYADGLEILSGLKAGDVVALP